MTGMIDINKVELLEPLNQRYLAKYRFVVMDTLLITKFELQSNSLIDFQQYCDKTIEGFAQALLLKDKETRGHAERATSLTEKLARKLGFDENELVNIRRGALLHDIGKIGVPDSILFKPDQLTDEEWVIMKQHPAYAYELLSPIPFLQPALDIPYCHHEHWDGNGYPRGLSGEQIPYSARLFTLVDVWDALCSDRCYRLAWKRDRIVAYMISQSGKIFDPQILGQFLELIDRQNEKEFRFRIAYSV